MRKRERLESPNLARANLLAFTRTLGVPPRVTDSGCFPNPNAAMMSPILVGYSIGRRQGNRTCHQKLTR